MTFTYTPISVIYSVWVFTLNLLDLSVSVIFISLSSVLCMILSSPCLSSSKRIVNFVYLIFVFYLLTVFIISTFRFSHFVSNACHNFQQCLLFLLSCVALIFGKLLVLFALSYVNLLWSYRIFSSYLFFILHLLLA